MKWVRRFLVVQAFMLWQGGFLFYASFVVPIGTDVLESATAQGGITRHVTDWLNVCGAGALLVCAWDLLQSGPRQRARWSLWIALAVTLAALAILHPFMEPFVDEPAAHAHRSHQFRILHRTYLWITTFQWLFALVFVYATLRVWGEQDTPSSPVETAVVH